METHDNQRIGVVILAAGKGTRLGCTDIPKVMKPLAGKPIVDYAVDMLHDCGFGNNDICLVVGFKQEKVREYFGNRVIYASQTEQLGTAHAAYVGMRELNPSIEQVLVMNGDDSAFYTCETMQSFIDAHLQSSCILTLLTSTLDKPTATIGRVLRHSDGTFDRVVEKEHMTDEMRDTNLEISTNTFMFNRAWYERMFPKMPKIEGLGEFGLPTAVDMAKQDGCYVQAIPLENSHEWFGVNTPDELAEAEARKSQQK